MGFVSNTNKGARNLVDLVKYLYGDIVRRIGIDDTATARTSAWSSQKTSQELSGKATSTDINTAVSAHNSASDAHSALLADYSTTAATTSAISTHDADTTAHSDIRTTLSGKATASDISTAISTHNSSSTAHSDIRTEIDTDISTHNSASTAHSYIRGLVTTAQSTADSASTTANAALPKSGGTMTGTIGNTSYSGPVIKNVNGTYGGEIYLFPATNNDYLGGFLARAYTTSGTVIDLMGKSDGSLKWGGNEVERVSESGTGYIRYASGLQICWGQFSGGNGTCVTFPASFATGTTPRVCVSVPQRGSLTATYLAAPVVSSNTAFYINLSSITSLSGTVVYTTYSSDGPTMDYIAVGTWA